MSDTLLDSLSSTFKRSDLEGVARNLGESEQTISRGLELSAASIFSRLVQKSGDSDAMRQIADLASKTPANAISNAVSGSQFTNPNSSLMSGSERFLSSLFGSGQSTIANSIARESGLRSASAPVVMALGAQSVLSYLGTRVRDGGMSTGALSGFLQKAGTGLQNSLPAGFSEMLTSPAATTTGQRTNPVMTQTIDTNPVVAQTVRKEGRSFWLWLLPLAAILLGILWFAFRHHPAPPVVEHVQQAVPQAVNNLGNFVARQLPGGTTLNIPANGVEGKLLAFIQDPSKRPDKTSWFDFDRLLFDTGSATLQPQSDEQLRNIAAIMKAYPNVHLKIGGYTDNVGSAAANMKLSTDRANNVMNELTRLGVAPNRLTAEGYGSEHPVADNSTEAGRAQNRRISMLVTQK